jgi:hypothetical protein
MLPFVHRERVFREAEANFVVQGCPHRHHAANGDAGIGLGNVGLPHEGLRHASQGLAFPPPDVGGVDGYGSRASFIVGATLCYTCGT